MRVLMCLAIAGAVVTATPAFAQNNAAASNAAATNEAAPLNAMTSMPAGVIHTCTFVKPEIPTWA